MKEYEQEKSQDSGVKPEIEGEFVWFYVCGECREKVDWKEPVCKHCGRRVDWNG